DLAVLRRVVVHALGAGEQPRRLLERAVGRERHPVGVEVVRAADLVHAGKIALWRRRGKRGIVRVHSTPGVTVADGRLFIGTRRYSSWSMRGWLAVRLAGLDVEEVVIPLTGGGSDSEVARRTPSGTVPYLEHNGNRVWETIAICEYCAELNPALWPERLEARTHARVISAE